MKNLIFIEGVSGVGKSTTATVLCEKLRNLGYSASRFLEGDSDSPLDLFYVAYLTGKEYSELLRTYPALADQLQRNNIVEPNYALVRYQDTKRKYYSPETYRHLKSHEFCFNTENPVPLLKFSKVFINLWRRFAESEKMKQDYMIFDGSLLHHQINDLIRNYNAVEDEITAHLSALLRAVEPLNPVVFYLSTHDVGRRLAEARQSRGQTVPTDEQIAFWEKRKQMDLEVLERLSIKSHIMDTSDGNWDGIIDDFVSRVTNTAVVHHYDSLIDENNDPVHDSESLKEYMDKWDGQQLLDALQLSPDKVVLEIGVGTGRLALRVCGNCKSFTGIDISPQTIARTKENLRKYDNINLICANFLTYPFSVSFEVIYSSLTFMHIKDKRAAIRKTADLLNPSGLFVLSISKSQDRILEYGDRKIEIYPDTLEQITALLTDAGLTMEKQFETEFAVVFAARKGTESYES